MPKIFVESIKEGQEKTFTLPENSGFLQVQNISTNVLKLRLKDGASYNLTDWQLVGDGKFEQRISTDEFKVFAESGGKVQVVFTPISEFPLGSGGGGGGLTEPVEVTGSGGGDVGVNFSNTSINVGNFPATQPVSVSSTIPVEQQTPVDIGNFPASFEVENKPATTFNVDVDNFPTGFESNPKSDYFLELSKGNISGHSVLKIQGRNKFASNVSLETVWDLGGSYVYSSNLGVSLFASCEDAGASYNLNVFGLDENFNLQNQTVAIIGQTKVAVPGLWTRVFSISQNDSQISAEAYVFEDDTLTAGVPDTTSKIRAIMNIESALGGRVENQSKMAIATVPAGKTGYLSSLELEKGNDKKASFHIRKRSFGKEFQDVFTVPGDLDLNYASIYKSMYKFPEKTDIEIKGKFREGTTDFMVARFDLILVDN